jgi:hemolysin III
VGSGAPFLILAAIRHGGPAATVGASVFAGTVVLLYVTSTLYHALPGTGTRGLGLDASRPGLVPGIAYTAGLAFYAAHRVRYHHLVWHLFVLAGTGCHFVAALRYAA